jgi:exonuclease SbcC
MKILHLADIHARDKDIEEIEKCLNFILETAKQEQPDFAVNSGDTFDSCDVKLDSQAAKLIVRFFSELVDICPVAVVIGTASHDGMAAEILRYVKGNHFVTVSSIPEQLYLVRGELYRGPGIGNLKTEAVITMIPQPTKQFLQASDHDLSAAMSAVFMGFGAQAARFDCPHVLCGHWNVSGARLSNGQTLTGQDIEIAVDQMMLADPDLICLGHIHKPQKLGLNVFYSGSIYTKDWGEDHEHGFWIHDISPKEWANSIESRFVQTPCRKMVRASDDFISQPIDNPGCFVPAAPMDDISGAYVRHDFKVYQDEAGQIDRAKIEEFYKSAGAESVDIRIIRIPRVTVRSEAVLKLDRLRDKIKEMAAIKNEEVCETILAKADQLEDMQADSLLAGITGGQI